MKVKLGELTKIRTGKLDANAASEDGTYPFFTCSKEPLRISTYSYNCECVLVAGNGDLNAKYYNGKFDAYQRTYIIESNGDGRLHLPYLYHFMTRYIQELRKLSIGGVIKYIKLGNLTDAEISLPSVKEQKDACEKLKKIKNIIDKKEAQISYLDNLIKARFVEMFGLPGTDPFEYGKVKLGECCEINPKKAKDTRLADEIEVSFVSMPSVSEKGEIDPSDIRKYEVVKKGFTYFAENDVLFAKITPCMENGKGAVAKGLMNGIGFGSTEFHVLRPIEGLSNSYWIYVITSFKTFRRDAKANMTGSAGQRRTPASFLESYEVSLPPIELQNQFAAFVAQVDKSKFALSNELAMCNFYVRLINDSITHSRIDLRMSE